MNAKSIPRSEYIPSSDEQSSGESVLMLSIKATQAVLLDRALSPGAKLLWYYICEFSFIEKFGGDAQGGCFCSVDFLSHWMGSKHSSVCKWQKELVARGHVWIDKVPQISGWARNKYYLSRIVPPNTQRELILSSNGYKDVIAPQFGTMRSLRSATPGTPVPPMRHAPVPPTRHAPVPPSDRSSVPPSDRSSVPPSDRSSVPQTGRLIRGKGISGEGEKVPPSDVTNGETLNGASSWDKWKGQTADLFPAKRVALLEELKRKLKALHADEGNYKRELHPEAAGAIQAREAIAASKKVSKKRRAELRAEIEKLKTSGTSYTRGALKDGPVQEKANLTRKIKFIEESLLH